MAANISAPQDRREWRVFYAACAAFFVCVYAALGLLTGSDMGGLLAAALVNILFVIILARIAVAVWRILV